MASTIVENFKSELSNIRPVATPATRLDNDIDRTNGFAMNDEDDE